MNNNYYNPIFLSGDIVGKGIQRINTTISNGVVGVAKLSATGTPSSSTYLRGDNTWATIPSGGTWGSITGTLSSQTDLQNALNLKYDASNPAGYITSSALSGYLQNNVGIAGGTTLIGGTASGNNLTLVSTSNATKGKILFGTSAYDEVNNRLGIGTSSPNAQVHLKGVSGVNNRLLVESPDANPIIRIYTGTTSVNRRPAIAFTNPNTEWAVGFNTSDNKFRIAQGGDLGTDATTALVIDKSTYNIGIRTISPTAALHIRAGTASANTAPLKLTAGTNLTTPEDGAFEFDGTNLYFTVGGVRKTVSLV